MISRRRGTGKGSLSLLAQAGPEQDRRFSYWLVLVLRNRRELRALRKDLNRRVKRGEIHRRTRDAVLAAEWQRLRGSWLDRRLGRLFAWTLVLVPVALMIVAATDLGPAWAAAHGHGTPGYFVPVRTDRCDGPARCTWYGNFTSRDGRDLRLHIKLDQTLTGATVGQVIPALDSGDPFAVFPRRASAGRWSADLGVIAGLALLLWLGPLRLLTGGWRPLGMRWGAALRKVLRWPLGLPR